MRRFALTACLLLIAPVFVGEAEAGTIPGPVITSQPAAQSQSSTISWTVGAGQTSECSIDDGTAQPCQSPFTPDLSDGYHVVYIRALGQGYDQSDTVNVAFTLDRSAPAPPQFIETPAALTAKTTALFVFSGESLASFSCQLDDSDPFFCFEEEQFDDLDEGDHTMSITQTDAAGNVSSPAVYNWQISAEGDDGEESDNQAGIENEAGSAVDVTPTADGAAAANVNCTLEGELEIDECLVEFWAKRSLLEGDDLALAKPKLIKIGEGRSVSDQDGLKKLVVKIKFNKWGKKMLARNLGGFPIEVRTEIEPKGGVTLNSTQAAVIRLKNQVITPSDSLFDSDSSYLNTRGISIIRRIALRLPKKMKAVTCVGHTDNTGPADYNYWLGKERAKRVCSLLRKSGLRSRFQSKSLGESRPRASNKSAWGRSKNRRVEIILQYYKPK